MREGVVSNQKIGHTAIAIGSDFFDYGPKGDWPGPASPWWADPSRPTWQGRKRRPEDIALPDILAHLADLTHLDKSHEGFYDVVKVEWCVCKSEGKGLHSDDVRNYWRALYKLMNSGADPKTLPQYKIPGWQCTSRVICSINYPTAKDPGSTGRMSPEDYLSQIAQHQSHTCGRNKAKPVRFERIQTEKDPYEYAK